MSLGFMLETCTKTGPGFTGAGGSLITSGFLGFALAGGL